jgi:hypothetical protein
LKREQILWREKSKAAWMEESDANTHFFHLSTIIHRRYNTIDSILMLDNCWETDWFSIGNNFDQYFTNIFLSSNPSFPFDLQNLISPSLSEVDTDNFCSIPNPKPHKKGLFFSMKGGKSPRPDGMTSSFYKSYWHIIGERVIKAVQHFFCHSSSFESS